MPKRSYKGDKRRREIAKKKKRDDKLQRKVEHTSSGEAVEDNSYLEYLHPGGLPEELREDEDDSDDEDGSADE